jgi:hypothetical protein
MFALHWILATVTLAANNLPATGQIGAFYFETAGSSQVWIRLEPQGLEHGPNPILLTVTASFQGKRLEREPDIVELRVESIAGTFPNRIRQRTFSLAIDNARRLDLTDPAHSFQFVSTCGDCPLDTVIARVPFGVLRDASASQTVTINALGFAARLNAADLVALGKYVAALRAGVVIQ